MRASWRCAALLLALAAAALAARRLDQDFEFDDAPVPPPTPSRCSMRPSHLDLLPIGLHLKYFNASGFAGQRASTPTHTSAPIYSGITRGLAFCILPLNFF